MALRATLSKVTPDEARIEAELLVAHTLEISRAAILAHPEIELSEDQSVRLAGIEARRIGGEPLAYILGNRQFFGLEFEVGPDVLILGLKPSYWSREPSKSPQTNLSVQALY